MPKDYQAPKDFKEAFHALRLQKELKDRKVQENYYVFRPAPKMEQFKTRILVDESPAKFLYSGHRKSGKTTELYRLISDHEITRKYFVVFYSIGDDLEIGDIDYIDILLTNAMKLYEKASENGVSLSNDLLEDLNAWLQQVSKEIIQTKVDAANRQMELGAKIKFLFGEIGSAIKTDVGSRKEIREKLSPRTSEVIEKSNFISSQIHQIIGKRPLLVIDDLDKLDPEPALKIFHGHTQALMRPQFKIVYTVPIALAYSPAFKSIEAQFDGTIVLPTINSRQQDGSESPDGQKLLESIVLRRLDQSLIQERALKHMIDISNGVLSDLLSIAETCCIKAISSKAKQIDWNMVDEEMDTFKAQFKRSLPEEWYNRLAEIHVNKDSPKDPMLWEMLNALAVLEYEPGPWYDVHPVILQILKDKKLIK